MYAGGLPSSTPTLTGGATVAAGGATLLPVTGSGVIVLALLGAVLLGAGLLMLSIVKRRHGG
ncbi:MAG: LPXTG cell wall anchor domain-containing protein [Austwickia sp.]|jgi:LPXTG-motif cell wall-anchored protein|nr:MAG: LPXTG cell wall anchor domain-containing protein [Austwickia sp.]